MKPPESNVVVVTGANEGIGHHLLRALVDDGYRVAGLDVNTDELDALGDAHPDRVRAVDCDVRSDDDVERAVDGVIEEWGQIDVLVNNAAVFDFDLFADRRLEQTREEFEVNYFGYLRMVHAVLPYMRERGLGIGHNVSSGVGLVGNPGLSGYASTKGAIDSFTRSLRLELQDEDVHCTRMYPPLTNTRSAARLDYPEFGTQEPEVVGRKLADRIESTRPVIYADWSVRIGLWVARRFPFVVKRGTRRFLGLGPSSERGQ
jgi:NAD(P)-dependent dehydrogenase (short-subunit alcohol dehydrogenase family)